MTPREAALRSNASAETLAALDAATDLEAQLEAFLESARVASVVAIPPDAFLTWVGQNLGPEDVPRLSTLNAPDLALAYACAQKDSIAQALFVQQHATLMRRIGGRLLSADRIDDLLQIVTTKLLVGVEGDDPRIARYRGRGDLGGWVRVVTTREALGMLRKDPKSSSQELDDLAQAIGDLDSGPEIRFLKKTHANQFAEAFQASIAALTPRQRNLLRYSLVEGLSIDVVGEIYGVHRATAARWIEAARAALCEDTKARLATRLALAEDALDSLLRFIWSAVDLSLDRLLAVTDDEPE